MNVNQQAAQIKDFLTVYNSMSETCFSQCVHTLNSRKLEEEEARCVDYCIGKFVKFNHRLMQVYANIQGDIMKKRIKEAEEEDAKAAAVAASANSTNESTVNSETSINSSPPEESAEKS